MFFAGYFLSMIIRSECEEEIISLSDFEDNSCPFGSSESIELDSHHTLLDELGNISLKACDATISFPAKIGMSDRDDSARVFHNSTRYFGCRFIFWDFDRADRISSFTTQAFSEKSCSIRLRLSALLVNISLLDTSRKTINIRREMSIIEGCRTVSFGLCP